jgi:hypothetical protein
MGGMASSAYSRSWPHNSSIQENTNPSFSIDFGMFEQAYQTLTEKLQPQVFSLGFLR